MRIVELGKCISNEDPLGAGRIRIQYLDVVNSNIERAVQAYEPWDEHDPFLFNPFLPLQVNIVPQPNQLVKLILWNIENYTLNREYIAGPYVNAFDFHGQGIDRQLQATSRGIRIKKEPNLFNPENGELIDPTTKGLVANPEDSAYYGKYGSDILFTRNGIVMRSGKMDDDKFDKTGKPSFYSKPGRLAVKKYDETLQVTQQELPFDEPQHTALSMIVEYEVEDIGSSGTTFSGFLRASKIVVQVSGVTDTLNFNQNSEIDESNKALLFEEIYSGLTLEEMGRDISQQLRRIDMTETQFELNNQFFKNPSHPFYYKPTKYFWNSITGDTAITNTRTLFSAINLAGTKAYGLSFSATQKTVPTATIIKTVRSETKIAEPTTISTLFSDIFYLLSYEANVANDADKINFDKINNYEPSQEEILGEIHPKTYSQVRGEPLIYLLELIVEFMTTHVHNPCEVGIAPQGLKEELLKTLQSAKEQIINQKLRIN